MMLFTMTNIEKIQYVNLILRGDAKVQWQILGETYRVSKIRWDNFIWVFLKRVPINKHFICEGLRVYQLEKGNISVKEYSNKLNALADYASRVENIGISKIEIFLGQIRSNIIKDVMIGDYAPRPYSKALGRALKSKAMRQRMTRERRLPNQFILVAQPRDKTR